MTVVVEENPALGTYQVLLFYKYVTIANPDELAQRVKELAEMYSLVGRVIVAEEGINATFEGLLGNTEDFIKEFAEDMRFAQMPVKRSSGNGASFSKLSVKVRNQIVGTGFTKDEADPRVKTAAYVSPDELRQWYEEERDFTVIDMRNEYEFASGHFKNAIEPGIRASRELPGAMPKLESYKHKKVVTVCTGGIRCESMAAYLLSKGFTDVHQLEGGLHSYMEKYPGKDFLGTLYTFDARLTMDFGGDRDSIGACHLCGATTEQYVNCASAPCHYHFLACSSCRDAEGRAYCNDKCK